MGETAEYGEVANSKSWAGLYMKYDCDEELTWWYFTEIDKVFLWVGPLIKFWMEDIDILTIV